MTSLGDITRCFEGAVPAVVATVSGDGTPNVTYLSRVRRVDDDHVALSNQFFSKTTRNLAENPRASLLLVDPVSYDEWRLTLVFERNERKGRTFEQLRDDVDALAALTGMQDVFKLRGADVYRVVDIEPIAGRGPIPAELPVEEVGTGALAELSGRLTRCPDLDTLVSVTVDGLADLLGYEHSMLLLLDEEGTQLYTIASHGYATEGVGSEVPVGEGIIGMAAARTMPIRLGNLRQMAKYGHRVHHAYEGVGPGHEIPLPDLPQLQSRLAVPAMALGQLVGVLVVEAANIAAFAEDDEAALTVIAGLLANAIHAQRAGATAAEPARDPDPVGEPADRAATHVRFFAVDGSTFLDGEYLIKGVAGRILWSLLGAYDRDGRVEFTNREVRLDPSLELPEFRDNLESRLILLKRRLDERAAPIRLEKTGRGRFRIHVDTPLRLDSGS